MLNASSNNRAAVAVTSPHVQCAVTMSSPQQLYSCSRSQQWNLKQTARSSPRCGFFRCCFGEQPSASPPPSPRASDGEENKSCELEDVKFVNEDEGRDTTASRADVIAARVGEIGACMNTLKLKTVSGHSIELDVHSGMLVGEVRDVVMQQHREMVPGLTKAGTLRLVHAGQSLDDDVATLAECHVSSAVYVMRRVAMSPARCM
jgi:hypothetical protein